MERVILDSGVLVAGARGTVDVPSGIDVALPAVAIAEYLAGVLLDSDVSRRAAQRAFLDEVLAVVPICDYDRSVAEHHAELLSFVRRKGRTRGAHDLIIAATARATQRTLWTTDQRARFDELPGVTARLVGPDLN